MVPDKDLRGALSLNASAAGAQFTLVCSAVRSFDWAAARLSCGRWCTGAVSADAYGSPLLAASGAALVLSITSAGRIAPQLATPCFVLIERALRDEGTSHHYQPPAQWSHLPQGLRAPLLGAFAGLSEPVLTGSSWTTDAPYRETAAAIAHAQELGVACVEMEAAGLYAYAAARGVAVVCFAHITNTMATDGNDFEKGADYGVRDAMAVAAAMALT